MEPVFTPWGESIVLSCLNNVVLPQPEGPHKTTNCPCSIVIDMSSKTFLSCSGYAKVRFLIA